MAAAGSFADIFSARDILPDEAAALTRAQYRMLMEGLDPIQPKISEVSPSKVL